jgi:hypothetical protein
VQELHNNIRSNIVLDLLERAEKLGLYSTTTPDVAYLSNNDEVSGIRDAIRRKKMSVELLQWHGRRSSA